MRMNRTRKVVSQTHASSSYAIVINIQTTILSEESPEKKITTETKGPWAAPVNLQVSEIEKGGSEELK